jgi:hypothetical protein
MEKRLVTRGLVWRIEGNQRFESLADLQAGQSVCCSKASFRAQQLTKVREVDLLVGWRTGVGGADCAACPISASWELK